MSSGNRFVETLRKLGYPKAINLDGEDFDWLFETTVDRSFLDWFCTSASEQNVLSDDKLQAFNSLEESGKAVLDEKALDEVLKTCQSSHSKTAAMEEVEIEKLEEDLHALQRLKSLHIGRRNKLQVMASGSSHVGLKLKDKEEGDAKALKEILSVLQVTSNKLNHELQTIIEGVQKLILFFTIPEADDESCSHPVFLSQIVLEKYLSSEEQSTAALTLFTKEHFFEALSTFIDGSDEKFELVQLEATKKPSALDDDAHEDKCKEMMRLQLAYICAKHKLIQSKAREKSLRAGLQWAEDNIYATQNTPLDKEENLKARLSSLKKEMLQIQNHIDLINCKSLPGLVKENAQLLNMPIVKGDYDLQIARQNLYASRQDLVCNHLMKQKASFEFLQLAYEIELRKHRHVYRQLDTIIQELKQSGKKLEERLLILSDTTLLSSSKPRNNIDSKDSATHRLYQLLDGDKMQQLFRTYDGLECVAQKLNQNITTLKTQLAVSEQEQSLALSKLDTDLKTLHDFMYPGGNTLLLNAPELSSQFQQLDSQLAKLHRVVLEFLGDIKAKRNILASNKLHKMEKQLYVYFFKMKNI